MVFVLRRPYAFAHGGWHRGWHGEHGRRGWRGEESWGGRGFGGPGRARRMLRWVYERLGTSPAQETVLADAAEAVADSFEGLRGEWEQSRGDLARALRAEPFDVDALKAAFGRHDERIKVLRDVVVTQGARVHDVLDARQRAALADALDRAPGRSRWNV
ncbi:MAG: periplasmic heavy metal sensor [Myxococcaceae bacterium]